MTDIAIREYKGQPNLQPLVAEIAWTKNTLILGRCQNPLQREFYLRATAIIEQSRGLLIWGRLPEWSGLAVYTLAATAVAWAGYAWFQKTRKGFADVL